MSQQTPTTGAQGAQPTFLFGFDYSREQGDYWHPSNVLYHYGDVDCPLSTGDFVGAMHLCHDAALYELQLAQLANGDIDFSHDPNHLRFVEAMSRYAADALEARDAYQSAQDDQRLAVEKLRAIAQRYRAMDGNENADHANNFAVFADALEADDYRLLAI